MNALQAKATGTGGRARETSKTQGYGVELEEDRKSKAKFPGLPAHVSMVVTTSCLAMLVCLLLISMSKWRMRVTCRARGSCWFTTAKLCKGLALWESGGYQA